MTLCVIVLTTQMRTYVLKVLLYFLTFQTLKISYILLSHKFQIKTALEYHFFHLINTCVE
jgi:hypothetical protein